MVGGVIIEHYDWSSCAHAWPNHCGPAQWCSRTGPRVECALPLAREGGTKAKSLHQNPLVGAGSEDQFFKEVVDLGSQNCMCVLRRRATL